MMATLPSGDIERLEDEGGLCFMEHSRQRYIVRVKEDPNYEELFVSMKRLLKRTILHLGLGQGSRQELCEDIRCVLLLVEAEEEAIIARGRRRRHEKLQQRDDSDPEVH